MPIKDILTIDDSGFLSLPSTTSPISELHIDKKGNIGIGTGKFSDLGNIYTTYDEAHWLAPRVAKGVIECEYCGHRYPTDTKRLYCSQCGAPLPLR